MMLCKSALTRQATHSLRAVLALELKLLALEEDIVESPGLRREDGGHSDLTALDKKGNVDRTRASITGRP